MNLHPPPHSPPDLSGSGERFGRHRLIETRSVEAAFEALGRIADVRSYALQDDPAAFALRLNHLRFNHLDVTYSSSAVRARIAFGASRQARQQIAFAGSAVTRVGARSVEIGPASCVIPPDAEVTVDYGPAYEQVVLRIDEDALTARLEALTGSHVRGKLAFAPQADARDPHQQRLRLLIFTLDRELAATECEPNRLIMAEYAQLVTTGFLLANLRDYDRALHGAVTAVVPWQVRAAEDYIEANWSEPITIEDLARVTGAGVRALFKTFKDTRGFSPMTFAKQVRLKHARALLSAGHPDVTVTGVALRCGFFNLGHFAAQYRRAFAELPSETLARHKSTLAEARPRE
jgi:AraC-like DNA-binding protein